MPALSVTVSAPATSANLGPGFDALGLALDLHNTITLELRRPDAPTEVVITGEGVGDLQTGADNLICRAAWRLFGEVGAPRQPLGVRIHNRIPVRRGLGSSATAIVGGLVAANRVLGDPLDREAILRLAVELEGHPDNVCPALFGGFQVSVQDGPNTHHVCLPTPPGLRAVVCVPNFEVGTAEARACLPATYSRADAVFNLSRCALLAAALSTGRTDLLGASMRDRIHQPYRSSLIPGFDAALEGAISAGAHGACLSGSGSTLLAFASDRFEAIGAAMVEAITAAGGSARSLTLDVDHRGTAVLAE